jgi:hypothetical protein
MEPRKGSARFAVGLAGLALMLGLALACGSQGGDASEPAPAASDSSAASGQQIPAPPPAGDPPVPPPPASDAPVRRSPVVVRLNGEPITIDGLVGGYPRQTRGERTHAIDNAVQRILTAREARRRGLDATDAMRAKIEALHRQAVAREEILLRDALQASLAQQVVLTEADLRAHYAQTQVRYTRRRMRLREASFDSREAAQAADQRLGLSGRLDPSASREIGPLPIDQRMQAQLPGVMGLQQPGQRILVEREGKFALIELEEELPQAPLPFEEVRGDVEQDLRSRRGKQAFDQLSQQLVAASRVEMVEEVLQDDAWWQQPVEEAAPLRQRWR